MSYTLVVLWCLATLGASCGSSPIAPESGNADRAAAAAAAPMITTITPSSGPVGTTVTITGSGFLQRGNHLKFGNGYIKNIESADGVALRFAIPDGLDLCAPNPTAPCPGAYPAVRPGDYVIAVMADGQPGGTVTFTVTPP